MSTKEPIQSASCPESCETGWRSVLCKFKALVCRAQKYIDPLCETDWYALTFDEYVIARKFVDDHVTPPTGMMTPFYPSTSEELRSVLNKYDEAQTAASRPLRPLAKGRLTLLNRIGMAFAYGTGGCPCCVAYRAYLLSIVAFAMGYLIA